MKVFEPLVSFVGKLPFKHKLRMFAIVFGVPLFVITATFLEEIHSRVAHLEREVSVLKVQLPALTLQTAIQELAAVQHGIAAGAALDDRLPEARQRSVKALAETKAAAQGERLYAVAPSGDKGFLGNWDRIGAVIDKGDEDALNELSVRLRQEIENDVGANGLLTDSDFASSRLLDVVSTHLPGMVHYSGLAAQIGVEALARKAIRGGKRSNLTLAKGNLNALTDWSMENLRKVSGAEAAVSSDLDNAARQLNVAFAKVQEATTIKMLDTSDFDMEPAAYLDIHREAMTQVLASTALVVASADHLLAARLEHLRLEQALVMVASLMTLLLVATAFIAAYVSIMRGLRGLSEAVETMAAGDLAARVEVSTKDEIGDVAHRFNEMARSLAERTEQLRSKTNDINVMLHTLPQGILTIVADGGIHPEYSSYLETILEKPDLAGLQATDILFQGSDLSADARASMEAAIAAASGEDTMNFEFNSHLLPGEVKKSMPDGRVKILELTWSPISDDADIVEKIMVSVRDVTEMRRIMAEADHQRQELEMIGQILRVPQEKFDEFISGARAFIAENTKLIQSASGASPDLLASLFRNMHTIKGNARTFNLLHITSLVHDTEQVYQSMRDTGEPAFDPAALIAQLEQVSARLEEYANLNTVTLGRTGPGRRGSVEKYVMVRREHVEAMLDWLRAHDLKQAERETMAAVLQQVRCDLELLGTEPLAEVLAPVTGSMPDLARELGKEPPAVKIVDNGVHVRHQASELLRNVFTHLYRNAIDHGIETAADRIAAGKQAVGEVVLAAQMDGDRVLLELFDDGRGLALAKVRAKAAERGLLGQGAGSLADREVANLIFASGFSTAAAVTEVSGRGVGMDAVREFLKSAGGDIEIRLTGGAEGDDFRPFRMAVSLPAKLMAKASPESPVVAARAQKPGSAKSSSLLGQVIDSLTGGDPKGAKA